MGCETGKLFRAHSLALKADNSSVRIAAVEVYGGFGKAAIAPLIDVLKQDPHGNVRRTAAKALSGIMEKTEKPDDNIIQAFIAALAQDGDWHVRVQAAQNLGALRPVTKGVLPPLTQALSDGYDKVQLTAAKNIVKVATSLDGAKQVGAIEELKAALRVVLAYADDADADERERLYGNLVRAIKHLEVLVWNQIRDDTLQWVKK